MLPPGTGPLTPNDSLLTRQPATLYPALGGTPRINLYSYSTPTDLRVEAQAPGLNVLYWAYTGNATTGIYRAPHGGSYTLIDVVIDPTALTYADRTAIAGQYYDYKVSDNGGVTYSNVASVVAQIFPTSDASTQSTTHPILPQFPTTEDITPEMLTQLSTQVEAALNLVLGNGASPRCLSCVENGAVVFNCDSGCIAFEVVVTEDINSISIVGCNSCPDINFIIPAGATRLICGWPAFCGFEGDECTDAPITGPRVVNSDGTSHVEDRSILEPDTCTCPVSSTIVTITCCEADKQCAITCAHPAATMKACGGYPPYTWSHTGDLKLSSTTKEKIRVTKGQKAGDWAANGISASAVAFEKLGTDYFNVLDPNDCGGTPFTTIQAIPYNITYNCGGSVLATGVTGETAAQRTFCIDVLSCTSSGNIHTCNDNGVDPLPGGSCESCASSTITYTYTPSAPKWANAQTVIGTIPLPITSTDASNLATQQAYYSGPLADLRTQAMVNAGCGCTDNVPSTVTVTDRTGQSATVIVS